MGTDVQFSAKIKPMGVVSVYARIEMKLRAAGFASFFQQPIEQFPAIAAMAESASADQIIHIERPPPCQKLRDAITGYRDDLIPIAKRNEHVTVILHLALSLGHEFGFREFRA